ncbi:MAG TPA: AtpZ/AtpI family protein [Spirochaetota bacterium]|nr:AtpZ/AtpI family protein [Spirochaetota bacterium]
MLRSKLWLLMQKEVKKTISSSHESARIFDRVIGLAFTICFAVFGLILAGRWVDKKFGFQYLFTIIFAAWGFSASMVYLYIMLKKDKL